MQTLSLLLTPVEKLQMRRFFVIYRKILLSATNIQLLYEIIIYHLGAFVKVFFAWRNPAPSLFPGDMLQ